MQHYEYLSLFRNFGAVSTDVNAADGYYIVKFSSSPYTLKYGIIIVVQVISSVERLVDLSYLKIDIWKNGIQKMMV